LRDAQRERLERLLPDLEITTPDIGATLDPGTLFGARVTQPLWLEVGFGAGEHLIWQAETNRDVNFIGCEPFLNGVARVVTGIDEGALDNIKIFPDDARIILSALPDQSVDRAFILFPDPWPKLRHQKRRLIGPATLTHFARILTDGAELRIATDYSNYKDWILHYVLASEKFEWTARRPVDWRERPTDWPATRYEAKADAAGRACAYFRFKRRQRQG
jgi:tRNA (guanine-N7-)-methyltransferase